MNPINRFLDTTICIFIEWPSYVAIQVAFLFKDVFRSRKFFSRCNPRYLTESNWFDCVDNKSLNMQQSYYFNWYCYIVISHKVCMTWKTNEKWFWQDFILCIHSYSIHRWVPKKWEMLFKLWLILLYSDHRIISFKLIGRLDYGKCFS